MTQPAETIHLRREPSPIACGEAGPVRITRNLSEVTCPNCIGAENARTGRGAYVQSVELRFAGTTVVLHCWGGDSYYANLDGGKWWLQFEVGQPTEGPFNDVAAVERWLNEDE